MDRAKSGKAGGRRHVLSKSTFIRGCQCHKSLYLYKHFYRTRDPISPAQAAIFRRGTNVGVLARDLFPGGIDASPPTPFQYARSVEQTRQLIAEGAETIYEAAFLHDGVLAAMDNLVSDPKRQSAYRAYEVKSSAGISETYLLDAALQYWVMTGSGLEISDICIVHIDSTYVRGSRLEVERLFCSVSVHAEAKARQSFISRAVEELKGVVSQNEIPEIPIGPQCHTPYPCDFIGTCWRDIPEYSVFDIARLSEEKKFELQRRGILEVGEVPDDYPLSDAQRMQVEVERDGTPRIDRPAIAGFLEKLRYPLYFLDFESFQPAVPLFEGTRPYEQIPFQFSLHRLDAPGDDTAKAALHSEFLAEAGPDPREAFVGALLSAVGPEGSVVVYNRAFEDGRLAELSVEFPDQRRGIEGIRERIVDLMVPFRDHSLYTPDLRGSYSIKHVLPALAPDLSYDSLSIRDGTAASVAYEGLIGEEDARRRGRVRRRLLAYCKLDTLAMVRIFDVLRKEAAG